MILISTNQENIPQEMTSLKNHDEVTVDVQDIEVTNSDKQSARIENDLCGNSE